MANSEQPQLISFPSSEDAPMSAAPESPSPVNKGAARFGMKWFGRSSQPKVEEPAAVATTAAAPGSALPSTTFADAASETASPAPRAVRRVSFSPSIEEASEARELALSTAAAKEERKNKKAAKAAKKLARRQAAQLKQQQDEQASKVSYPTRSASLDVARTLDSAAGTSQTEGASASPLPAQPRTRRASFTWDRRGIRLTPRETTPADRKDRRSAPAKPRVTRKTAVAARHARIIEALILASQHEPPHDVPGGIPKRTSSVNATKGVSAKQMRSLKVALMNPEMANDIVSQLRHMKPPPGHGQACERGYAGAGGDAALAQACSTAAPEHAPVTTATEAGVTPAMEALGRLNADAAAATAVLHTERKQGRLAKATHGVRKRLSSTSHKPADLPVAAVAVLDKHHPVKAVWLDCCEKDALAKHHAHKSKAAQAQTSAAETAVKVAGTAGAGFAVWGAVVWLGTRFTTPSQLASSSSIQALDVAEEAKEETQEVSMLQKVPEMPVFADGPLVGVSPISLLLSPGSTLVKAGAAKPGGAFDQMASFTAMAVAADAGGLDAMGSIRPPLDRIAVFVHWWGFELTFPEESLAYLDKAHMVSGQFFNFLQTMVVSGGMPELLPFVKYISQYVEMEYAAIKSQNHGDGVIVAATWLMPFALVPRPWDYSLEPIAEPPTPLPAPTPSQPAIEPAAPSPEDEVSPILTPTIPPQAQRAPLRSRTPSPARGRGVSPTRSAPPTAKQEAAAASLAAHDVKPSLTNASPRQSFSLAAGARLDSLAELPEGSVRIKSAA